MATAKSTPATAPKETNMATKEAPKQDFDFSKLTPTEMLELAAKLQADAAAGVEKEFENDISYIVKRTKSLNKTLIDYVAAIVKMMDFEEGRVFSERMRSTYRNAASTTPTGEKKTRAPRGSKPPKVLKSADKDGNVPEVGKTYKLNGMVWKKEKAVGAVKKEFMDAVQHGAKWKEMEVTA